MNWSFVTSFVVIDNAMPGRCFLVGYRFEVSMLCSSDKGLVKVVLTRRDEWPKACWQLHPELKKKRLRFEQIKAHQWDSCWPRWEIAFLKQNIKAWFQTASVPRCQVTVFHRSAEMLTLHG